MRTLALDTSSLAASVALLVDDSLVAQSALAAGERVAQALLPTIHRLLAAADWRPADLRLIGVSVGPGSFTGLRVGVTTAKVLAYAVGAEVIGVNTLEAIAAQAPGDAAQVRPVLDAQRRQLFTALFERDEAGELAWRQPTQIVDQQVWLDRLEASVLATGAGLAPLVSRLPPHVRVAPQEDWTPRAATVGRLALRKYSRGEREDLWTLVPDYFRESAAEEKARSGPAADAADDRTGP